MRLLNSEFTKNGVAAISLRLAKRTKSLSFQLHSAPNSSNFSINHYRKCAQSVIGFDKRHSNTYKSF